MFETEESPKEKLAADLNTSPSNPLFQTLPVELQVEIFLHCAAIHSRFDVKEAPLLLCRICRDWRRIALLTPKLWSSFEIEVDASCSVNMTGLVDMVELWLKRSKLYPLSILLSADVFRDGSPNFILEQLFVSLAPHVQRWRHVHLSIPSANIHHILPESLPNNLSALRSLTLDMKPTRYPISSFDIHTLGIPWHQLTQLHLHLDPNHLLTLDDCLYILADGVNLTECSLNVDCAFLLRSSQDTRPLGKVNLPLLGSLRLILQGGLKPDKNVIQIMEPPETCLVSFLDRLAFVKLHTLQIEWLIQWDGGEQHWANSHAKFVAVLQNIGPTLKVFRLSYLPLSDKEAMECLAQLPLLHELELRFSLIDLYCDPITDDFLHAYTVTPSNNNLPLLEFISLECHGYSCANRSLIDMIQSRCKLGLSVGCNQLRKARFMSMKPMTDEMGRWVTLWMNEGLQVTVENLRIC